MPLVEEQHGTDEADEAAGGVECGVGEGMGGVQFVQEVLPQPGGGERGTLDRQNLVQILLGHGAYGYFVRHFRHMAGIISDGHRLVNTFVPAGKV